MWMNASSARRSTPATARRTGNPSPSRPDGAVVTESTGRSRSMAGSVSGTRGRANGFSTVTAGISYSFVRCGLFDACTNMVARTIIPLSNSRRSDENPRSAWLNVRSSDSSDPQERRQVPGRRVAVAQNRVMHLPFRPAGVRAADPPNDVGDLSCPDEVGRQLGAGEQRAPPLAGRLTLFLVPTPGHQGHRFGFAEAVAMH